MIIVNIFGGIGNQLFQYAAGRQLAEKHRTDLKLDIDNYKTDNRRQYSLHYFNIKENFCTAGDKAIINGKTTWQKLSNKAGLSSRKIYTERGPGFNKNIIGAGDNVYLDGYWQSERYFKPIEKIIRAECRVKELPSAINKDFADKIGSVNAVSIHVRRGDFVTNKETNAYHGVCSIDYYQQAIGQMIAMIKDPYFFVFSDDIEWTKVNILTGIHTVEYIDHNTGVDFEDLRLMYLCKHHIIANSSFSWWGAWLNDSTDKKVIAPVKWFQSQSVTSDIVPENWIKI